RFSSIYPPPLRSLFFPYTTLFRSRAWLTERGRLRGRLLGRGRPGAGFLPVSGGLDPCRTRTRGKQALVSVVPPDSVLDPKIPFEHLDDLPLPGRPAHSRRIDHDEITLPGHATSFPPRLFGVFGNGSR